MTSLFECRHFETNSMTPRSQSKMILKMSKNDDIKISAFI